MPQRVTLRQVADYAGVSVTTVSNVVRGWPYISDSTRIKVEQAIEKLGYIPHPIAQGLRTGRTQVVALIVPDLANPHFASMVSTIENVAREHGYNILVFNSRDNELVEYQCIQDAIQRWVDGLILVQAANATQTITAIENATIPVVVLDRIPDGYEGAFCQIENVQVARLVMDHLYTLGHRRIAHLAGPIGAQPARDRLRGYESWLDDHQISYRNILLCDGTWSEDSGYSATQEIFEGADLEQPTAIFASNDSMAIGALHALYERGFVVPHDISIVGVDNIEMCRHLHPPLTTVAQPLEKMARIGISMLLKLIDGETLESAHVTLMPELVVRESTAAPMMMLGNG